MASLAALPLDEAGRAYLARRGLLEVATDLRFGVVPASAPTRFQQYVGRLVIPSIGPEGNVYDVAFRCIQPHDCKAEECPKYLFLPGLDKRLYNVRAVREAGDVVDICEGQLDAATLEACGLHAVGVPGANGWKRHHRRLFQGFERVRVWADGDPAGKQFAEKVCNDVAWADVMMVQWGEDVNDVFVAGGKEAILRIAEGEDEDEHDEDEWFDVDDVEPEWPHDSERPPY